MCGRLGRLILDRQQTDGWGSKVIERLAADLRAEFPGMRACRGATCFHMRSFAGAWRAEAIVRQAVGRLPWGHVTVLLDKLDGHFADQAAGALALTVRLADQAALTTQLQGALVSRSVIDKAVGIVMAQNRCSADTAFDLLRQASQHRNVKLSKVAADIVTAADGTAGRTAAPDH